MKTFLIIFSFIFCSNLKAQEAVLIKNAESFKSERVESFLHDLNNKNDYVIAFRLKLTDKPDERSDNFVLVRKDKKLAAYNYLTMPGKLKPLNLSVGSLQLVWDTFIQNDLLSMQDESEIPVFCLEKYRIYNSYTYEFVLLNNGKMKKLSYYDPEYYDNACYGMAERRKIINCVSVISHVLNPLLLSKP